MILQVTEQDFERTNAKSLLTKLQYEALFPYVVDSSQPIITILYQN